MALTDNLVSYWKLDESSGDAADSVGSNTFTNTNTVTYDSGKINNGSVHNGTNQYFLNSTPYTLERTINAWIKLDVNNAYQGILCWLNYVNGTNYKGALFRVTNTGKLQAIESIVSGTATDIIITSAETLATGTWYMVTMTATAATTSTSTTLQLYLNGVLLSATCTASKARTAFSPAANNCALGTELFPANTSSYEMDGMIDEVGVWSRALTSTEVTELYNSGTGRQYPFISAIAFTILDTLGLVESGSYLRERFFSTSETLSLSEVWATLKGIGFTVADTLGLVEAYSYSMTHIISIADSLGLIELPFTLKKKWTNDTKNTIDSGDITNDTKNNSTWVNEDK